MEEALERSQEDHVPDLKVSFLLDYTRGSRGLFPFHLLISSTPTQALFGQTAACLSNPNPWSCCILNGKNLTFSLFRSFMVTME